MEVTEIFFWIIFSIVGLLIVVNYLRDINEYSPIIDDFFKLLEDHNDFKNNMTTYGILYILLIFVTLFIFYSIKDPNLFKNSSNIITYSVIVLLPLIYTYFKLGDAVSPFDSTSAKLAFSSIGIMVATFILFNYIDLSIYKLDVTKHIFYALLAFGVVVAFSILVIFLGDYLKKLDGNLGFFAYLLFYIPCMMIDFIKYIIRDFKNSPPAVYILYIVELCIILAVIYLLPLIEKTMSLEGTKLLDRPMFLDKRRSIFNGYDLAMEEDEKRIPRHNYSVSMWVYINAPPNTNETYTIFDYASKPKLMIKNKQYNDTEITEYSKDEPILPGVLDPNDRDSHVFVIEYTNNNLVNEMGEIDRYEVSLPLQKWNHFVFNYSGNEINIYINGELHKNILLTTKSPNYNIADNIYIGDNDDANGAICNVKYFEEPLTKMQIAYIYNLYHLFNPPLL
jgi:hypothetical protein